MLQILQQLRTGETMLAEVPAPAVEPGHVLIRTRRSLVSQGTEKMLVQFAKASLWQKARSQPDKVRQVWQKIRSDGLVPTVEAVFRRLDEPLPLGYCNVGEVIAIGDGGSRFAVHGLRGDKSNEEQRTRNCDPAVFRLHVGDRVASNGPHAEIVAVPANLVAKVPDNVSDDAAAFTVAAAIGLQGLRLAKPELGETVAVIGLGLIGQLTVQLLKAAGCRVIGFDFDANKARLARGFGVEAVAAGGEVDAVKTVQQLTAGMGADAVIITAATSSNEVIAESARMSRKRGRIVLVGVVGLELNRADFYEKELTFQVSCSYGPGRYEDAYEEKGLDYPAAFVRWTENRNFEAVLAAMAAGTLNVAPLITRRVPLANYREIYDDLGGSGLASLLVYSDDRGQRTDDGRRTTEDGGRRVKDGSQLSVHGSQVAVHGSQVTDHGSRVADHGSQEADAGAHISALGTTNQEPASRNQPPTAATTVRVTNRQVAEPALAVIGAGNFAKMTVLPALAAGRAPVKYVVSSGGTTGTALAKKYEVPFSSTDYQAVLDDPAVKGVIITTRHNLHAAETVAALRAGKHVLVEKPLCLNLEELAQIEAVLGAPLAVPGSDAANDTPTAAFGVNQEPATVNHPTLSVGYNRRFSPHSRKVRELLGGQAGPLSLVATMNAGAIPLSHWVHDPEVGGGRLVGEACHFVDLAIFLTGSLVEAVAAAGLGGAPAGDSASILLRHANGSTSTINYFATGDRSYPKERIEVFGHGRVLTIEDFVKTTGHGFRGFSRLKTGRDKGHAAQFAAFATQVKQNGPPPIPWPEIANGTRATLAIPRALVERRWIRLEDMK